jgi:hypothetical protein
MMLEDAFLASTLSGNVRATPCLTPLPKTALPFYDYIFNPERITFVIHKNAP